MPILPWEHVGEGKAWWLRLYGGRGRPGDSGSRPQPLLLFSYVGGICSIAQATLGGGCKPSKVLTSKVKNKSQKTFNIFDSVRIYSVLDRQRCLGISFLREVWLPKAV